MQWGEIWDILFGQTLDVLDHSGDIFFAEPWFAAA
jgi:hypothetical protein